MDGRHLLFLFLDGVGLGAADPQSNPFCAAQMPTLERLLGPAWFVQGQGQILSEQASMIPTDSCLGVAGRPQSATGQATLLTGYNVPAKIGEHFGPKPSPAIADILKNGNLFSTVQAVGGTACFLNPYPPRFFESINNGRRLLASIPLAAQAAGLRLYTYLDLRAGRAVSPDFTGEGWRERLNFPDVPLLTPEQAGGRMAQLAKKQNLTFFEHWPTDLVGHRQDFNAAVDLLERLDRVLAGLLQQWDWSRGMVLITSDHGNLEDMAVRTHTTNPVPTIFIGRQHRQLAAGVKDLTDITPAVMRFLLESPRG